MTPPQTVEKASQSFLREQKIKSKTVFDRGVYVGENTYQAASVRVVCRRHTRSARSRLHKIWRKAPKGIFDTLGRGHDPALHLF